MRGAILPQCGDTGDSGRNVLNAVGAANRWAQRVSENANRYKLQESIKNKRLPSLKSPLRLVHTSDVHLIDGPQGEKLRSAFDCVIEAVNTSGSNLFLIAGDLFDHNRVNGDAIEYVYRALGRVRCPVLLIPGNHDCFDADSVLRRLDFSRAGGHVHLLSAEQGDFRAFPELNATVWGQGIVDHAPEHRPLTGFPARREDQWHIGMVHGLYVDDENEYRSSRITPEEIAGCGFDYLALGHVHAYAEYRHGSTLACYPGAPTPYAGTTQIGSAALVDLVPGRPAQVAQIALSEYESNRAAA
jgi:DNA repair exonuclease SbcCD nuclease subunit